MDNRLKVLMLATYFPKPGNPLMGTWALSQAQALARQPIDLKVVSFTSWLPAWAARSEGASAYASCPARHTWGPITVDYPRWFWYPVRPVKDWEYRNPEPFLKLAWGSGRRFLDSVVRRFEPDVVYAHHTAVNGYIAYRLKQRYGIPFVVTDHDFGEIEDCTRLPGRNTVFQKIAGEAGCMVAVAKRMEAIQRKLFPEARTRTIHNGTDDAMNGLDVARRGADGRVVIFSCGAFYRRKGFPLLVEAFAEVARRHPDAILRIAGDGEERASLEQAIRRYGLHDRITLLGFLPHAQVLEEMAQADMFALIGWDEPFATVFTEAFSAGCPVVCCDDCGITDVMVDEVHGLLVPPRDAARASEALSRLVADKALRWRLGRAGRTLFESQLTWDHNARAMVDLFRQTARTRVAPHA